MTKPVVTIQVLYTASPMFPTIDVPRAWQLVVNGEPYGPEYDTWDAVLDAKKVAETEVLV